MTGAIVPPAIAIAPKALPNVAAGDALQTTWEAGGHSVTALVQALERAGLIRTLAEPNLTAISGETAKFHAGGKFPIPMISGSGLERQVTIQWETFGVQVEFKPVVMSEGRISLRIAADVSELSSDGAVTVNDLRIPALKVRRAETTLELPSGGTLAMAGLLSDQTRQNVEGVPGVKDVPMLGALFRSNDYQRRESELVILVTPYLATHAAKSEFARPDGGYAPTQHAARAASSGTSTASMARRAIGRTAATKAISGSFSTIRTGADDERTKLFHVSCAGQLFHGLPSAPRWSAPPRLLAACEQNRRAEDALAVGLGNPEVRHPIAFSASTRGAGRRGARRRRGFEPQPAGRRLPLPLPLQARGQGAADHHGAGRRRAIRPRLRIR